MPILNPAEDRLVIHCECNTHILKIEKGYDEIDGTRKVSSFWFQYYDASTHSLWGRFKIAWAMFIQGEWSSGDMIIEGKDFNKLIKFLQDARDGDVKE